MSIYMLIYNYFPRKKGFLKIMSAKYITVIILIHSHTKIITNSQLLLLLLLLQLLLLKRMMPRLDSVIVYTFYVLL